MGENIKHTIKLGILGGGQLGRMSAQAAQKLGIEVHIYCPENGAPASKIADKTVIGAYTDQEKLKEFASGVDVISYEFENIPLQTVQFLQTLKPVYPKENLLEICQDRVKEKTFLNDIGIPTTRWKQVSSVQDINSALNEWGKQECIIKTTRFGYDGKGQWRYNIKQSEDVLSEALEHDIIMEEIIDFACEISVIIARSKDGETICYPPGENEHKNHILDTTTIPATIDKDLVQTAKNMATSLANKVELVGVLALELFVTKDNQLLANEIAPRTHNSGHWSIDACEASQFENHVRSVCAIPLAPPNRHSDALMINLIGDDILNTDQYKEHERAYIHSYDKDEARPGRKMGHVTILKDKE